MTNKVHFTDIVFTANPDNDKLTFVEVEDHDGSSIRVGEWLEDKGFRVLRLPVPAKDLVVPQGRRVDGSYCCHPDCNRMAEFRVIELESGKLGGDDETHSCLQHIPQMLTDRPRHEIVAIDHDR